MDYIIAIIGILGPILLGIFIKKYLPSYLEEKAKNLATKEDIGKITKEVEEVKNIYKTHYDLSKTERDFYQKMINTIYEFLAKIKKYEFENNAIVTNEIIFKSEELKNSFFQFKDSASEFIAKSYVFLKEANYLNLKNALNTSNSSFADLANNLLDAMRKSLYLDTTLTAKNDLREFKYK